MNYLIVKGTLLFPTAQTQTLDFIYGYYTRVCHWVWIITNLIWITTCLQNKGTVTFVAIMVKIGW